jgi:preprotein translocase subunit SecD
MSNLKYRLILIAGLVLASAWFLFPRDVKVRLRRQPEGTFYDTVQKRIPLRYGLDLQGGMHLTLEVDDSQRAVADKQDAIDRALKVVRTRIDEFGVSEPVVQKAGDDRIIVELPGIDDRERAIQVVQGQAFLEFRITDETQALERALPRLDAILREKGVGTTGTAPAGGAATTRGSKALEGLLSDSGTKAGQGRDSAKAQTDSLQFGQQGGAFSRLLTQGSLPGEYFVEASKTDELRRYLAMPEIKAALPPAREVLFGNDSTIMDGKTYDAIYVVDARPIITGDYLTDARPTQDPIEGTLVQFELSNEGGRRFRAETGRHIKDYMAIVLDRVVMGRPPVIQSAIGTRGQITMGGKDLQAAQDLALVLRAGALPVPLRVAEVRTIGPSLGEDAIRDGIEAGLLGLALVVVIMVGYYRFSGTLAVAGLAFYAITTLGFLAAVDATLTLPGIAGFILSIGMAVDANFLQFERIREELGRGKTVRTAVDEGFKHSWSAIVDTHVTTALTAAVLYQYGTGPVKGFAVTLIAGVASSMISSVFVVRTLFLWWLSRSRTAQTLSI